MSVNPVPAGYHTVTPYLVVTGAAQVIDFAREAFGAEEIQRHTGPEGAITHAEIRIGDSVVMLGEASAEYPPRPGMLHLYVADVDAVYQRALQAGAISLRELRDEPYGDRTGGVQDASGTQWWLATRIK